MLHDAACAAGAASDSSCFPIPCSKKSRHKKRHDATTTPPHPDRLPTLQPGLTAAAPHPYLSQSPNFKHRRTLFGPVWHRPPSPHPFFDPFHACDVSLFTQKLPEQRCPPLPMAALTECSCTVVAPSQPHQPRSTLHPLLRFWRTQHTTASTLRKGRVDSRSDVRCPAIHGW